METSKFALLLKIREAIDYSKMSYHG